MAGPVNTENGTLKFVETLHSLGGAVFVIYPHPEGPITREKLCSEYIKYNIHIYYIQNNYFHYRIISFSTFTAPKQLVRNQNYCQKKLITCPQFMSKLKITFLKYLCNWKLHFSAKTAAKSEFFWSFIQFLFCQFTMNPVEKTIDQSAWYAASL